MPPLKNPVILDKPIERVYTNSSGKTKVRWYEGWGSTPPWGVVVHYSAGYNAQGCMEVLTQRGLSVHCSIERDGSIWKHVEDEHRGIHAGYGRWAGVSNMNNHMFGFEVINFGPANGEYTGDAGGHYLYDPRKYTDPDHAQYDATVIEWLTPEETEDGAPVFYRDDTYDKGKTYTRILTQQRGKADLPDHREEWAGYLWARYPRRQMRAVLWQTWEWIQKHEILPEMIVGHEHVTPHKKQDPGPAFGWKWFTGELEILYSEHLPHLLDPTVRTVERVKSLQSHLDRMNLLQGGIDGDWGGLTQTGVEEAIETYNDTYTLGLTAEDAKPENVTKLCFAFLNVLGEDPGRS